MKHFIFLVTILVTSISVRATTYTYDESGRVINVIYENGAAVSYQYDADGNQLLVTPAESSSGGDSGGTDNGGGETGGGNTTPEPPKDDSSGGSFGFGLLGVVFLSLFRRLTYKKSNL